MKSYLALIRINLRLAMREKSVLFFNYFFPLLFFFGFGQMMGAKAAGTITRVITMVLVIGILGSGLFGAGMRTVMEREANILRRFKVTPISALPILVSSVVVGWLLYLPALAIIIVLAHFVYGMPWPQGWFSLIVIISVGCWTFRAIGLIIASVANSMAESNILVQILYLPMLFLSGVTIPISAMPVSMQVVAQFMPASYLNTGVQRVLLRNEPWHNSLVPISALLLSGAFALFVSLKLFRWEKEERIAGKSKLWVLASLFPFVVMGVWEGIDRGHIIESKLLDRETRRANPRLIRGGRVFVGDGRVLDNATVLVKGGKIVEIFHGRPAPKAEELGAELIEAAGKTVLPGLIDTHVHLGSPGGAIENPQDYDHEKGMERALAAYLYSGVTAVRSAGDFADVILRVRDRVNGGEFSGAELFVVGPLFTAPGGHGTELFKGAPEFVRAMSEQQFTRLPAKVSEAREQVRDLKTGGVDAIKVVLEAGVPGLLFRRMELVLARAVVEEARFQGLPAIIHTGDAADVADAASLSPSAIEHGSTRNAIPDATFAMLRSGKTAYDPTLSVIEAFTALRQNNTHLLDRSLTAQVAPEGMAAATKKMLASPEAQKMLSDLRKHPADLKIAGDNLLRASKAGIILATGTDSGNLLLLHGPAVHRELQLWVQAGISPAQALLAATRNAAVLLGAGNRLGLIQPGYEATLIVVDGNPLEDIAATERISTVIFKGEHIDRQDLFDQK
jgi:imidazolonepropionase-like amidohydrolase/ABC-type multidrug transport system permease subunit